MSVSTNNKLVKMSAKPLIAVIATFELFILIFYGLFVRFDKFARMEDQTPENLQESLQIYIIRYPLYQNVHVMMFIGFGFLMTYLKQHSWSGVSINFISAVLSIQVYILFEAFWRTVRKNTWGDHIEIDTFILIRADYAAAAVLITFGAVIGKINTAQMLVLAIIETFLYALVEMIVFEKIQAIDAGGSICIHTFGAYFGLAFSLIFSPEQAKQHPKNKSGYVSNIFGMLGTLFLWMYWPSFNSAIVEDPAGIHRATINTVLSLTGSCLSVFLLSAYFHDGKFHMEDILNATLAGGVVIGSSCDVNVLPFVSIASGFAAGLLSCFGYRKLAPFLETKIGLLDTAGIHNLHAMPGALGGLLSACIIAGLGIDKLNVQPNDYNIDGFYKQGALQVAATFTALGFGIVGGVLSALLLKSLPLGEYQNLFEDKPFWANILSDSGSVMTYMSPKSATVKDDHGTPLTSRD